MNTYIESLNWRYATKKFDSSKKISATTLANLLEAIRLTASSYGLQPYNVLIIDNPEVRKQLQPVSWGQSQIVDASHLIVFAHKTRIEEDWIDQYLELVSDTREIPLDALHGYGDFMKSKLLDLSIETQANWAAKQTYISMGNLLSAAATMKIDACPIEGFEPEDYNRILGLSAKGLSACLVAALGYRAKEDETQHAKKVRRSTAKLFTHI